MTKRKDPKDILPRGRKHALSEEECHELGRLFVECMKREGVYHISHFCIDLGVGFNFLLKLIEQYPLLSDYYEEAKVIIGNKMMKLSMEKHPSQWIIKTYMPRMLGERDQWIEDVKDEAKAKAEAVAEVASKYPEHPLWSKLEELVDVRRLQRDATSQ